MSWNSEVREKIDKVLKSTATPKIAVFDADGTLWHDDIGEGFFKWQIQTQSAPGLIQGAWEKYRELEDNKAHQAYAWLAEINAGLKESEIQKLAKEFYDNVFPTRPHPVMKALVDELHQSDFEVWICTASIRWAVEPTLQELGIPKHRLIGVSTEVKSGIITTTPVRPISYREGKKLALQKTLSAPPLLVAGNSMGDAEMLTLATVLPLVIGFTPPRPQVIASEQALQDLASERRWPVQIFKTR